MQVVVGAVQMHCALGDIDGNILKAARFVREAKSKGAQIVVLPELMASGYVMSEEIWEFAEPPNGPTETFLKNISAECDCYVGASFLEARPDGHFYNVFSLADNQGNLVGRVYKQKPASFEAFFFTSLQPQSEFPHIIETPLAKIGVQICYENLLWEVADEMREGKPEIILASFSAPLLVPGPSFPKSDCETFNTDLETIGGVVSRIHGVPTVYCNKTGSWESSMPLGWLTFVPYCKSRFPGKCAIFDNTGKVQDKLNGTHEGTIVGNVTLRNYNSTTEIPKHYGKFIIKPCFALKAFSLTETLGRISYNHNRMRFFKARSICAKQNPSCLDPTISAPSSLFGAAYSCVVAGAALALPLYFLSQT